LEEDCKIKHLKEDWADKKSAWKTFPIQEMSQTRLSEESRTCESDLRKKHTQISITKLRDRKQVVSQPIHKSDIIQGEAVIYLDDAGTKHLTILVIPKSHILLIWQGSEAGEPFLISGYVSWAIEIYEPRVL
jgi:hypothetical protein